MILAPPVDRSGVSATVNTFSCIFLFLTQVDSRMMRHCIYLWLYKINYYFQHLIYTKMCLIYYFPIARI